MAIPVQHHQSTQRSLYMCDISLFLVTIWHSSAPRVTICRSPSLIVTVRHLEAVRNDKPDPVPWFQAVHLTANLLHHSCVHDPCHSHMNNEYNTCVYLAQGCRQKNVNVLHGGRRVEPVPSLPSMTGNWLPVLGLYRFTCVWRILWFFIIGMVVDYQLSKSSTKTLRHLQKWNKTLIKRRIFPQAKNNL